MLLHVFCLAVDVFVARLLVWVFHACVFAHVAGMHLFLSFVCLLVSVLLCLSLFACLCVVFDWPCLHLFVLVAGDGFSALFLFCLCCQGPTSRFLFCLCLLMLFHLYAFIVSQFVVCCLFWLLCSV